MKNVLEFLIYSMGKRGSHGERDSRRNTDWARPSFKGPSDNICDPFYQGEIGAAGYKDSGDGDLSLIDLQEVMNSKARAILTGIKIVQIDACAPICLSGY